METGISVKLFDLLECIDYEFISGQSENISIHGVCVNSATLKSGDLFLATKGATVDRHDFIDDAISKGASAVIVSKDVNLSMVNNSIPFIKVPDVNAVADRIFSKFYGDPASKLQMLAVTGTDGKTSVATIIQQLLGINNCINVGTNGMLFKDMRHSSFNTTPDSNELYAVLNEYAGLGAKSCVMEFSSEAQHYNRLKDLRFDVLGLTNITSEHLNTHGTLENYVQAKIDIFLNHLSTGGVAVLNADDQHFNEVFNQLSAANIKISTYGRGINNDLQIVKFSGSTSNTMITFKYNDQLLEVDSPLLGDFNVENLATAILILFNSGYVWDDFVENIANINISGRLDMFEGRTETGDKFNVLVDYAHTPNGITRLLEFIGSVPGVNRRITVIGQAGERDKVKRPIVGKIVAENSDLAIFTSEDPKNEDPKLINADIIRDLDRAKHNWIEIIDRSEAIKYAVDYADGGDLVMVLGKGAEDFQKIGNTKIHYSDIEEVTLAIKGRIDSQNNDKDASK